MAQPIEFRYFLRKPNGTDYDYYFINPSGNVDYLTSSTPIKPLLFAPDGWMDKMLNWERKITYDGVMRTFSVPLKWVKDGAKILRYIFFNEGVEGLLELYIEKFNYDDYIPTTTTLIWNYEPYYYGEMNFKMFRDEKTFANCEVTEGGFFSKLTSRDNSNYEIKIRDNPNVIWVRMHPFNFLYLQKWVAIGSAGTVSLLNFDEFFIFNATVNEGINSDGQGGYHKINDVDTSIPIANVIQNLTSVSVTYNIEINGSVIVNNNLTFNAFFGIRARDITTSTNGTLLFVTPIVASSINNVFPINVTGSISIAPGGKLAISGILGDTSAMFGSLEPNGNFDIVGGNLSLKITFDNATKETFIPALRPKYVFDELINNINEDSSIVKTSTLLGSVHSDKVITSFDALRNLPKSVLKTNLRDFHTSHKEALNSVLLYKQGSNEVLYEYYSEAYQNTQILDLGEVSEVKVSPFTQDMCSKFIIGQSDYTYDNTNGKDEFNTLVEYLFPFTRFTADKDIKSVYRRDAYGIYTAILNLEGKEVTDADSDNDVAQLHIENTIAGVIPAGFDGAGQSYYNLYRKPINATLGPNYWQVQNIYSPETMINFFFSPHRCLKRNGNWIHSLLFGLDAKEIKFQTSSKSNYLGAKLKTIEGSSFFVTDEGANIPINSLDSPLWLPFLIEVKTIKTHKLKSIMDSNPYGYLKFTWLENDYYGYIMKASQEPATNKPQTFTLLAHPSCNLNNLIY